MGDWSIKIYRVYEQFCFLGPSDSYEGTFGNKIAKKLLHYVIMGDNKFGVQVIRYVRIVFTKDYIWYFSTTIICKTDIWSEYSHEEIGRG